MKLEPSSIQLRFVPLEQMLLHEEDDPIRVKRLMHALRTYSKLRNPPILAEHEGCYIVLDGATRTTALSEMKCRDALVQVVDYYGEAIKVSTWHHVLVGMPQNYLLSCLADVDDITLQPVDPGTAKRMLDAREIACCVVMRNGQQFAVLCTDNNVERARLLCELVAVYRGKAEVHRTVEVDLPTLIEEYSELSAVIVFPPFSPDEIIQVAMNGAKMPMGITRHLVSGRALGLDVPLDMLGDAQALESKNEWLREQIGKRLQTNKIRLYQEPVFIFDE